MRHWPRHCSRKKESWGLFGSCLEKLSKMGKPREKPDVGVEEWKQEFVWTHILRSLLSACGEAGVQERDAGMLGLLGGAGRA